MTREHTPKPGANWQQQPTTREVVVPDGPWGGPTTIRLWDVYDWPEPRPNRAQRRAAARAARKANR